VHGANRLASNSLLEGLVFARRIADDIAERIHTGELVDADPVPRPGSGGLVAGAARGRIQEIASTGPGVIRTAEGLQRAGEQLAAIATDAADVPAVWEWETTNLHQVATGLTFAAELREETRGGHYREDFPTADDERWSCRIRLTLDPDGELVHELEPVHPSQNVQ
jgi:L-aspartate oxidase